MRVRSFFRAVALFAAALTATVVIQGPAAAISDEEKAARAFKFARGLFDMEKYSDAASELEKFAKFYENNKYSEYAMYLLGESYYKSGEYAKALERYGAFLKKYPSSKLTGEVLYSAGYAATASGDAEGALGYFSKLSGDPDPAIRLDSLFKTARILSDKKDYPAARRAFSDYFAALGAAGDSKDPSGPERVGEALFLAGNLALRDRDFAAAKKYYSDFLKDFSDVPMAIAVHYNAGEMEYSSGRRAEALKHYSSALGVWEKVSKDAGEAKNYGRYVLKIKYSAAWCHYSDKDYRRAAELFAACFSDAKFENRADAGLRLGICQFNARRFDEASKIFSEVRGMAGLSEKTRGEADYYLALSLQKGGSQADALAKFENLSGGTGEIGAESAYMAGVILFDQKKYGEAASKFAAFLKKFPDSPRAPFASFNIGLANFNMSKYAEAAKAFEGFAKDHPSSAMAPRAYFNLGEIAFLKKDYAAAEEWLSKIPESDPVWLESRLKICDALYAKKDFDRLGGVYDGILSKIGSLPAKESEAAVPLLFKMGKNLAASRRYDMAAKVYEKIISASKSRRNAADARFRLASVLAASGENEKALSLFDALLFSAERGSSYGSSEVRCEKGKCLVALGKPKEAAAEFDAVIGSQDAPEHVKFDARYSKGLALSDMKEYQAAAEIFENLSAEGQDIELLARTHYQLARNQSRTGKIDDAIKNLLKIEILFRDAAVAEESRLFLLELYVKNGKRKDAKNLWEEISKSSASREVKEKARDIYKNK